MANRTGWNAAPRTTAVTTNSDTMTHPGRGGWFGWFGWFGRGGWFGWLVGLAVVTRASNRATGLARLQFRHVEA